MKMAIRNLQVILCFALTVGLFARAELAQAQERWQTLPPTPMPIKWEQSGLAKINGIKLYYAQIGQGTPVILLHGGLANSDYFTYQVKALAPHHRVIVIDTRGHGRSARDQQPFGYDLMADDVIGLMNQLCIDKADIVGWSDGGIQGLDLAMRYPDRVRKIVAFGANTKASGLIPNFDQNPVFAAFIQRAHDEYPRLSSTPTEYKAFLAQIAKMWASQPNWTDAQLQSIQAPVLIVDGEHDEAIKREHTEYIAATLPHGQLMILPGVSHFAFIQDPKGFNMAISHFLDD